MRIGVGRGGWVWVYCCSRYFTFSLFFHHKSYLITKCKKRQQCRSTGTTWRFVPRREILWGLGTLLHPSRLRQCVSSFIDLLLFPFSMFWRGYVLLACLVGAMYCSLVLLGLCIACLSLLDYVSLACLVDRVTFLFLFRGGKRAAT